MSIEPFPEAAKRELVDVQLRTNLRAATDTIQAKRARVVGELPDWEELRDAGSAIKADVLAHLDEYLIQFEAAVTAAGGQVHWASDAAEANAVVIESPVPTHSSAAWTPRPPVRAWTASTAASPRSAMTSVAPNSRATAWRAAFRDRAMIRSAPRRLDARTADSPTAPSPTTATVIPGPTPALTAAWWPVQATSERARTERITASE